VLTERDLIMRLVRQLAEMLAAALKLRREGKREEALAGIDQVTGRLTGMDARALCVFGETALGGIAPELRLPLARLLRARAHLLRDMGDALGFRQALRAGRLLIRSAPR
jgi:hypothetical protein